MKSLIDSLVRLKDGLRKTKENFSQKLSQIFSEKKIIDENDLESVREALLLADVGYNITEKITNNVHKELKGQKNLSKELFLEIVKRELIEILSNVTIKNSTIDFQNFNLSNGSLPIVIAVVGVNGTGKTTTVGKLAYSFKKNNHEVLIAAADTFRAAANEQLEIWSKRADVEILHNLNTQDPAAVVYEALDKAIRKNIELLLIDTAGRLHTKIDLMNELNKIIRVVNKKLNREIDEVLLVIDSTTGQNANLQIENFLKYVPITGLILTKLDGTAKGGVIFQIVDKFKIPVRFIGVGEGIEDFQPFDPQRFVDAIFE